VGFVATGYILTWASLAWYALRLSSRSRQAESELARTSGETTSPEMNQ